LGADHPLFATRCERKIRNIRIGNKHNVCNSGAIEIGVPPRIFLLYGPLHTKIPKFLYQNKNLVLVF
jgi:hypothetical protein